jgi:hypothetical protein
VWQTHLEEEMLVDRQATPRPGFALVTLMGHPSNCDMCALILRDPTCIAYMWDEGQLRYVPSELTPAKCGKPLHNPSAKHIGAKQPH